MLNIAFVIDKTQTLQIVWSLLLESVSRGHNCHVFCNFDKSLVSEFNFIETVRWTFSPHKAKVISIATSEIHQYDVVFGINLFNVSWRQLYESGGKKCYSLEYCWNEMYNQTKNMQCESTLLCNSRMSQQVISDLSKYQNIDFLGSPWFEFLSLFEKKPVRNITVLSPHSSMLSHSSEIMPAFTGLLRNLRKWCDSNKYSLTLRTRKKYSHNVSGIVKFDNVVTDSLPFEHVQLYSSSAAVFHFCSSAINELSFLRTPNIALCNDVQKRLHASTHHHAGISRIHDAYYSDTAFDGIHYAGYPTKYIGNDETIITLENLISSEKSWKNFQQMLFPGNHCGSSARILDMIEGKN